MLKGISIYQRAEKLYIGALHRTQAGFWITDDVVNTLTSPNCEELRVTVRATLERSRDGLPTPPRSSNFAAPLLAAANVSSWGAFARGAKHVDVFQEAESTKITSYRNAGTKRGFEPMQDRVVILQDDEDLSVMAKSLFDSIA